MKHLYTWSTTLGRLVFDVASLPLIALWAYALLSADVVDYSDRMVQMAAYGIGIVAVIGAVFSLFAAGNFLYTFALTDIVGSITLTLQGVFPALVQIIPAAGFAWLAWDSNVEITDDEEDAEIEA